MIAVDLLVLLVMLLASQAPWWIRRWARLEPSPAADVRADVGFLFLWAVLVSVLLAVGLALTEPAVPGDAAQALWTQLRQALPPPRPSGPAPGRGIGGCSGSPWWPSRRSRPPRRS